MVEPHGGMRPHGQPMKENGPKVEDPSRPWTHEFGLVSTEWLAGHLDDGLVVVDMRWREDRSGKTLYEAGHLAGARHLDWTSDIVDPQADTAFMVAGAGLFARAMGRMGIGDNTRVVAYADQKGSGPHRLWWASRLYGHDSVRILDGGLDKWVAEGRPITTAPPVFQPGGPWTPLPPLARVATADDVASAEAEGVVVLDARREEQFRGEFVWYETGEIPAGADGIALTPRGDIRAGRVPWARNVPFWRLYRPDLTMRSPVELRELFGRAGVDPGTSAITYCGVGISASALLFALTHAGVHDVALYDGSWEEWGRDPRRPIVRGPD
jgi:thiosulfate/3-mercaptopyruvate sulfurtransferase